MRSINRYFNGVKTGFTGFRFHCAHHSQSNITTTGPYNPSPRPQEQTEKKTLRLTDKAGCTVIPRRCYCQKGAGAQHILSFVNRVNRREK